MSRRAIVQNPPAGVPGVIDLADTPIKGGESNVYFSLDDKWAVKIYHRSSNAKHDDVKRVIQMLAFKLDEQQQKHILRPLAWVESLDKSACGGVVMHKAPPLFKTILEYVVDRQSVLTQFARGHSWRNYLLLAKSIAASVEVLHDASIVHTDIHYKNVLGDMATGQTKMLEMDGIAVEGYIRPRVQGMIGYMAPEILAHNVAPNMSTDRHSLAVLILALLLLRNPMEPPKAYANSVKASDKLGYGKFAVFTEHPAERRHRPARLGVPFREAPDPKRKSEIPAISYRILPPRLQELTERALIFGIVDPHRRPTASMWLSELTALLDLLIVCYQCGQHYPAPFWESSERPACPFCGCPPQRKPTIFEYYKRTSKFEFRSAERRIVVSDGMSINASILGNSEIRPSNASIATVRWSTADREYTLTNRTSKAFVAKCVDGNVGTCTIPAGGSFVLRDGWFLDFGSDQFIGLVRQRSDNLGRPS